jgi:hypothetical protein
MPTPREKKFGAQVLPLTTTARRVLAAIVASRTVGQTEQQLLDAAEKYNVALTRDGLREAKGVLIEHRLIEEWLGVLYATEKGRLLADA